MTAVVAETDQGKAAKEPPAKPGKEETGNGTKPTPEVMWAWEQGLPRPEQLPGTNSQLLTPSLANAFGIQMMNGYRYPLPPPSQESGERANGESRAGAPGSYHDPVGAAQMQASMPPPYGNFHHSMPPPGSANAQAAAAAAMASAAMASYGGFPGMYQAPFGAQRPGGHYDPYGRSLGQGGDRGMGPSQGASSITQDPNPTLNLTHLDRRPRVAIERRRRVRSTPRPRSGYYKYHVVTQLENQISDLPPIFRPRRRSHGSQRELRAHDGVPGWHGTLTKLRRVQAIARRPRHVHGNGGCVPDSQNIQVAKISRSFRMKRQCEKTTYFFS